MKLPQVSTGFLVALVAIALLASYGWGRYTGLGAAAFQSWEAGVALELHGHDAWATRNAAQRASIAQDSTAAVRLARLERGQQITLDSLLRQLAAHPTDTATAIGVVASCRAVVETCQARAARWETAFDSASASAVAAVSRANRADSLLKVGLKVASCRFLFLRCPSRTTVGLVSLGLGLIGGIELHR